MRSLTIHTLSRPIPLHVGPSAVEQLPALIESLAPSKIVLFSDRTVAGLYAETIQRVLPAIALTLMIAPGEASKTLDSAARLYDQLAQAQIGRDALLLNLGGGVVGDLGGFVAATWLRGIAYIQLPTTTEAALDASVGGKTAVNHPAGKNLIGAFHQPSGVIIDTDFLATLPPRDFVAGLAESVKHAATLDVPFFEWHEQNVHGIARSDAAALTELIQRNCLIKAGIVRDDEREAGRRMILNHGHTAGHALESALEYELRHGECVALGMLVENEIAVRRGTLPPDQAERIARLLQDLHLPCHLPRRLDTAHLVALTRQDKKNRSGLTRFVLLNQLGQTETADDVTTAELEQALKVIAPL